MYLISDTEIPDGILENFIIYTIIEIFDKENTIHKSRFLITWLKVLRKTRAKSCCMEKVTVTHILLFLVLSFMNVKCSDVTISEWLKHFTHVRFTTSVLKIWHRFAAAPTVELYYDFFTFFDLYLVNLNVALSNCFILYYGLLWNSP